MTTESDLTTKAKNKTRRAKRYRVLIFNDDYTPFSFVTSILFSVFNKSTVEANAIAQATHSKGSAVVGCYSYEIAGQKIATVTQLAEKEGHPLLLEMEPESI